MNVCSEIIKKISYNIALHRNHSENVNVSLLEIQNDILISADRV